MGAARLVVRILVVARTRGREQHDVAGLRGGARILHRMLEVAAAAHQHAGTGQGGVECVGARRASKPEPLARPPAMRWMGASNERRATSVEATFVALESLT